MARIKLTTSSPIKDGSSFMFNAPCDCSVVEGLAVHHPGGSQNFLFKDAHGNDLTGINNLFVTGALVKVILDVTNSAAFIQNADTNGYLEAELEDAKNKIREQNTGSDMTFWIGTTSEYKAISPKVKNCFYILSDDGNQHKLDTVYQYCCGGYPEYTPEVWSAPLTPINFVGTNDGFCYKIGHLVYFELQLWGNPSASTTQAMITLPYEATSSSILEPTFKVVRNTITKNGVQCAKVQSSITRDAFVLCDEDGNIDTWTGIDGILLVSGFYMTDY